MSKNNSAKGSDIQLSITDETMNKKPVLYRNAKSVLNLKSTGFGEKLLCDSATLNLGDACAASCSFCYVEAMLMKLLRDAMEGRSHQDVVIRRTNALELLRGQLVNAKGVNRYTDPTDKRVVYSSTLVDCAGNWKLAQETAAGVTDILERTNWEARLLTKFNLLPLVVGWIPSKYHHRLILGVSTGTLDDGLAKTFEMGTALVSKRLETLHWLQDRGFRTFGMICPSLPQLDYDVFASTMAAAIRVERCEHVWAEVFNLRGKSFHKTVAALDAGGYAGESALLKSVSGPGSSAAWETYSRATFEAHAKVIPPDKLRYLQYVKKTNLGWWAAQQCRGAVLLGKQAHSLKVCVSPTLPVTKSSDRSAAARKAWVTMRLRYPASVLLQKHKLAAAKAGATRKANRVLENEAYVSL